MSAEISQIRRSFGQEQVPLIFNDNGDTVTLHRTEVERDVCNQGDVIAVGARVQDDISSKENVDLTDTVCGGQVKGDNIQMTKSEAKDLEGMGKVRMVQSEVSGKLKGRFIQAYLCKLGEVDAPTVEILNCLSVRKVSAGKTLILHHSQVQDCVSVKGSADVETSSIGDTLTCKTNDQCLFNCTIDKVVLEFEEIPLILRRNRIEGAGFPDLFGKRQAVSPSMKQTLTLVNTTVQKVIFRGGQGKVVLQGNSPAPQVEGGEVATDPTRGIRGRGQ